MNSFPEKSIIYCHPACGCEYTGARGNEAPAKQRSIAQGKIGRIFAGAGS